MNISLYHKLHNKSPLWQPRSVAEFSLKRHIVKFFQFPTHVYMAENISLQQKTWFTSFESVKKESAVEDQIKVLHLSLML